MTANCTVTRFCPCSAKASSAAVKAIDNTDYGTDYLLQVRYVKQNNFGGVMVWSLPLDDFSGSHCGEGPFPLLNAINSECRQSTGSL